ncbi:MAG: fructose-1,6-bisphosphatase [Nitrososphaerota archaeon]|nr:fructose-1,6-bisphosphatase [Nitrososphaerota archaeon]MDG7023440.1 fructose-1,6-bisphosphatase [Nitrososphaerota archaeon]
MRPYEWERVLFAATERVRRKVAQLSKTEEGGRSLGVGASGDTTIYADRTAEDEILRALEKAGPTRVLSEEAGSVGDARAHTLAIVDPLDGSSNFEHGIPFYCTSVAIAEGGSFEDITVGVVRDLVSGDVYSAVRGSGARKNGKRIRASKTDSLSEAVVGIDLSRGGRGIMRRLAPLVTAARRQVHFGANALELCYVAEGRTDAFVDLRGTIRITDAAAALLIAREAGGAITQADGRNLDPVFDLAHRLSFVASANPKLHKEILELIGRGAGGG